MTPKLEHGERDVEIRVFRGGIWANDKSAASVRRYPPAARTRGDACRCACNRIARRRVTSVLAHRLVDGSAPHGGERRAAEFHARRPTSWRTRWLIVDDIESAPDGRERDGRERIAEQNALQVHEDDERNQLANTWDSRTLLLAGIFCILVLSGFYVARDVVFPMMLAFMLNLLLQPVMRLLVGIHVPRPLAALLTLCGFFAILFGIGLSLAGSASAWLAKAPETLPRIEHLLSTFQAQAPMQTLQHASQELNRVLGAFAGGTSSAAPAPGFTLGGFLVSSTVLTIVDLGSTVILLFFLLVAGDLFLRKMVEILPTLSNKKQAVEISREIESSISAYLVTITLINLAVGAATGLATYLYGLADPLLWGVTAFVLNYVLILGPLINCVILVLVGLLSFDNVWWALLPAATYLGIHITEGETVTPLLMARRFTLNPVLVVASLLFWYWMWGIAGALLAIPMLATAKIVCDRIDSLMTLGHFLGGDERP